MNASELAIKMLQWEEMKRKLDELEDELKEAVLELGKTQTVGSVRATYSKGRSTYDYETPGNQASQKIVAQHSHTELEIDWMAVAKEAQYTTEHREKHTEVIRITDWRKVCKAAEIDPLVVKQGEPKVKVKLHE